MCTRLLRDRRARVQKQIHTTADIVFLPVNIGWSILLALGLLAVGRLVRVDGDKVGGVGAWATCLWTRGRVR
jgi:hypothetical protein